MERAASKPDITDRGNAKGLSMSSEFYQRRICKGLCVQLDKLGLCMGLCTTEPAYVQRAYDHAEKVHKAQGKPFEVIPYYAEQHWRNEALAMWLGDSLTRDPKGMPRRFFVQASGSVSAMPESVWCAAATEDATHCHNAFQAERPGGLNIMPLYIKSLSPLVLRVDNLSGVTWKEVHKAAPLLPIDTMRADQRISFTPQECAWFRQQGFDAIQVWAGKQEFWLVLEAQNIKSALGNNGKFISGVASLTDRPIRKVSEKKTLEQNNQPVHVYCGAKGPLSTGALILYADPVQAYEQARLDTGDGDAVVYRVNVQAEMAKEVSEREWDTFFRRQQKGLSVDPELAAADCLYQPDHAAIWVRKADNVVVNECVPAWEFARREAIVPPVLQDILCTLDDMLGEQSVAAVELGLESAQFPISVKQRYQQEKGRSISLDTVHAAIHLYQQVADNQLPALSAAQGGHEHVNVTVSPQPPTERNPRHNPVFR